MTEPQFDRAREAANKWKEHVDAITKPQDYPGLDAAGLLLVALGHLVKAKEKIGEMPKSEYTYIAGRFAVMAGNFVRYALKELDELKEKTCEQP